MSDSVRPHRRQPTRLPCPWDSPGKNTGVGCHFLLQCMKVKSEREVTQLCLTPSDPMNCSPPGSSIHGICQARVLEWVAVALSYTASIQLYMCVYQWLSCVRLCNPSDCNPLVSCTHGDSLSENHVVGCHFLLHGILPTH